MLLPLMAQNNTNSPYTRFGYGDLGERSFGAGRAMGGVGYGLRSPKQINPMNPASYSCMDSLTFLFDFGVAGQLSWFDDGNARQNDINGNVEYIAMQFPIHRRIALSFGTGNTLNIFLCLSPRAEFPRHAAEVLRTVCILQWCAVEIDIFRRQLPGKLPLSQRNKNFGLCYGLEVVWLFSRGAGT
mgnify:CR=1 FL=1